MNQQNFASDIGTTNPFSADGLGISSETMLPQDLGSSLGGLFMTCLPRKLQAALRSVYDSVESLKFSCKPLCYTQVT
jgi:hypothetical protein